MVTCIFLQPSAYAFSWFPKCSKESSGPCNYLVMKMNISINKDTEQHCGSIYLGFSWGESARFGNRKQASVFSETHPALAQLTGSMVQVSLPTGPQHTLPSLMPFDQDFWTHTQTSWDLNICHPKHGRCGWASFPRGREEKKTVEKKYKVQLQLGHTTTAPSPPPQEEIPLLEEEQQQQGSKPNSLKQQFPEKNKVSGRLGEYFPKYLYSHPLFLLKASSKASRSTSDLQFHIFLLKALPPPKSWRGTGRCWHPHTPPVSANASVAVYHQKAETGLE